MTVNEIWAFSLFFALRQPRLHVKVGAGRVGVELQEIVLCAIGMRLGGVCLREPQLECHESAQVAELLALMHVLAVRLLCQPSADVESMMMTMMTQHIDGYGNTT